MTDPAPTASLGLAVPPAYFLGIASITKPHHTAPHLRSYLLSPRLANSKTLRFVEILVLLILTSPLFETPNPLLSFPFAFTLVAGLASAAQVGLGLLFLVLRRASWIALLLTALLYTGLQPQSVEGPVLCLLASFLLFDSGWFARRTVLMASLVAASILAAQMVALFLVAHFSWLAVIHFLVTNGLFATLTVMFRKNLFSVPARELRPTLNLDDFSLSSQELQILHLFWAGQSSKEIAGDLNLSDGRVRN